MPYSPLLVKPMREELTVLGFEELTDADSVDTFMDNQDGTAFLVINSVCGCAAGMARPGVRLALDPPQGRGKARPGRPLPGQRVQSLVELRGDLFRVHHQLAP